MRWVLSGVDLSRRKKRTFHHQLIPCALFCIFLIWACWLGSSDPPQISAPPRQTPHSPPLLPLPLSNHVPRVPKPLVSPTLTIITGTHDVPYKLEPQIAACAALGSALHKMWTAWEPSDYVPAKADVAMRLAELAEAGKSCTFDGNGSFRWTFPLSLRPDSICGVATAKMLKKRSWVSFGKVYVPWFALRPDLVTLQTMAKSAGITIRALFIIGHDATSAAFSSEGCPRFKTALAEAFGVPGEIYGQRLLLVSASDAISQAETLGSELTLLYTCSHKRDVRIEQHLHDFVTATPGLQLQDGVINKGLSGCAARDGLVAPDGRSALSSVELILQSAAAALHGASPVVLKKTVQTGPRIVFVAGLEGTGHHLFSVLGRLHTSRALYLTLTDYLSAEAPKGMSSLDAFNAARAALVQEMRAIKLNPGDAISRARVMRKAAFPGNTPTFFLNTVQHRPEHKWAVNMYSLPWGGPRCYLKRYGKVMCNVDVVDLARAAEEAGVDFRVVALRRSEGSSVASAVRRNFGTVASQSRLLAQSRALLKMALATLDPAFVLRLSYEEMLRTPDNSAALLADHLGAPGGSELRAQFFSFLRESSQLHADKLIDGKWRNDIGADDIVLIEDLLL